MITEDYVSFEVAKLLKEKGFDEPCTSKYCTDGSFDSSFCHYKNSKINKGAYNAPTHQMAMKWLREIYHIFIEIGTSVDFNGNYHFSYTILDKKCKYVIYTYSDWNYEEAVETALRYALKNLI